MNMVWVACGKSRWGCERREDQNGSKKKEHLCGKQSGKWTGNEESARPRVKSSISGMAGRGSGSVLSCKDTWQSLSQASAGKPCTPCDVLAPGKPVTGAQSL